MSKKHHGTKQLHSKSKQGTKNTNYNSTTSNNVNAVGTCIDNSGNNCNNCSTTKTTTTKTKTKTKTSNYGNENSDILDIRKIGIGDFGLTGLNLKLQNKMENQSNNNTNKSNTKSRRSDKVIVGKKRNYKLNKNIVSNYSELISSDTFGTINNIVNNSNDCGDSDGQPKKKQKMSNSNKNSNQERRVKINVYNIYNIDARVNNGIIYKQDY